MPIIKRAVDDHPEKDDAVLWRYMDLSQLLSIMEREQLRFCRADNLGDPYEGSLTVPRKEIRDDQVEALKEVSEEDGWTSINRNTEELIKEQAKKNKRQREWVFINCWHLNEKESAAMWKLYSKSDEAIAIKTTFQRLVSSLEENEEDISLSKVRYLDFEEDDMVRGESTIDFLYKRKSFKHESEVRALFWDLPESDQMNDQPSGQYIDVDLDKLIEEIRISPEAEEWFSDTVERVLTTPSQYGIDDNTVTQSDLSKDPLF